MRSSSRRWRGTSTLSSRCSYVGRLKFDFHTVAGGARAEEGLAEVEGGIRLEEAPSREPAEVVEESREEKARRRAEMVLVAAAAAAALGPRTRAPVVPRAAAAACAFQSSGPTPSTRRRPHYGV